MILSFGVLWMPYPEKICRILILVFSYPTLQHFDYCGLAGGCAWRIFLFLTVNESFCESMIQWFVWLVESRNRMMESYCNRIHIFILCWLNPNLHIMLTESESRIQILFEGWPNLNHESEPTISNRIRITPNQWFGIRFRKNYFPIAHLRVTRIRII